MLRRIAIVVNTSITTIESVDGTKSPMSGSDCSESTMLGYTSAPMHSAATTIAFRFEVAARARVARSVAAVMRRSPPFRRLFAENAFRAEDEHEDQDPEDHGPRPVAPGRKPGETLVECLDESDQQRAEHRT